MQYDAFIKLVQERGGFRDRTLAEEATRATLETLGERLPGAEAVELAAQLPKDLAGYVERHSTRAARPSDFGINDFYRKVADRHGSDVPPEVARDNVRAVISTLREAVSEGEYTSILTQLPEGYGDLFD